MRKEELEMAYWIILLVFATLKGLRWMRHNKAAFRELVHL